MDAHRPNLKHKSPCLSQKSNNNQQQKPVAKADSNEFLFLNQLPKIKLDLTTEHYLNSNNNTNYTTSINEIEEYDNAVLDYFTLLNATNNNNSKDEIIYADDISYPFPTVILNDNIKSNNSNNNHNQQILANNSSIRFETKVTATASSECSSSFADLTHHHHHIRPKTMNTSTDNSLHTLSSSSTSSHHTNFESSSSSSFIQSSKIMQNPQVNSKLCNRFGFKPAQHPLPASTKIQINKSDSLSQNSSSISSSMPNSSSSNLPRAKSPFKSYLPRPPVSASNLKSHPSIPTSISNSISLVSSGQSNHHNHQMSRTISTSGVSSNSKHNQSSSLSSLSSTTSSNMSQNNIPSPPQIKLLQVKQIKTTSPTKLVAKPFHNQLSSSKIIQSSSNSGGSNQTTTVNVSSTTKRRLFSPYTLNLPASAPTNLTNPTNNNNNNNNINSSINSINLNQIYSSDFNNNITNNTNKTNQTKLKPPTITTQNLKIINLNANSTKTATKTKMPIKSSSSSFKLQEPQQINFSNTSPVKQKKDLVITANSNGSLIKREDSAYCSSTSSTVSSQEAEMNNKISPAKDEELESDELKNELINHNEETDSEFVNADDDYAEDNLNTIDNLKQTIMNLDLKSSSHLLNLDQISELNFDLNNNNSNSNNKQDNRNSICSVSKLKLANRNSIRDSIGELSQLMSTSVSCASPTCEEKTPTSGTTTTTNTNNNNNNKQRRSSSTSASNSASVSSQLFRPPSNLPPAENSEIIQLDIDSFRLIMQDIQNTKMILYKLASVLREPQTLNSCSDTTTTSNLLCDEFKPDDLLSLMTNNPLITSFYNYQSMCHNYDKIDQSTQTE